MELLFRGAATALVTPFCGGKVDFDALGLLIESQIEAGISALVVCGTTGEAATMTEKERAQTVGFAVRKAAGRVPVIAGAGSNDTERAVELCQAASDAGADALLVVTPYYNKTSQRGLIASFENIADRCAKPIILYNVPSRTGVNIEPETYAALSDHPNIVAIKEASGNISAMAETMSLVKGKLALYAGNDDQIVPTLALGGAGVISVLSNLLPSEVSRLCSLFFEGRLEECAKLQFRYLSLIKALFSDVNPVPVKEALSMLGKCSNELRLPLVGMEERKKQALKRCMQEVGLL